MRAPTAPVVSSVNVPTIPLAVAQAMIPWPRPPSPTALTASLLQGATSVAEVRDIRYIPFSVC
jgi:hypothetical protein